MDNKSIGSTFDIHQLIANHPNGLILIDREGKILDVNESYLMISGYERNDLISMHISDLEDGGKTDKTDVDFKNFVKKGSAHFQSRHMCKDGSVIDVEVDASVIDGEHKIFAFFLRDISDERDYYRALEEKEGALNCLHKLNQLAARSDLSLNGLLQEAVKLLTAEIVKGEAVSACITYRGQQYLTGDCRNTSRKISADFKVHNSIEGKVEVGLSDTGERMHSQYALTERQTFLQNFVMQITQIIEHYEVLEQRETERQQMLSLFNSMNDFIYVADPGTYELLWVNKAFESLWGENMEGRKCYKVIHGRSDPCPFCSNHKILFEHIGDSYTWEYQNPRNKHWYRCTDKAIKWDDGSMVRFELATDITELKDAQVKIDRINRELKDQVSAQTKELQAIIDSIPGLVFYKDTKNHFVSVNAYVAKLHNMRKEQLEWKNLFDIYPREVAQAYYEDDLEVIRSGKARLNIDEPWYPEGKERWLSTSKVPFYNEKGEIIGVIGIALDVTERKRLELEKERYAQQLKERNKELESFAYSVSHDLRSPLRGINGYSQILLEDYNKLLDEDGKYVLSQIRSSAKEMGELIDDLLQFSRMGRRELSYSTFKPLNMVHDLTREMRNAEPGRALEFDIGELPPLYGDLSMIREVFRNLISNAVKYTQTREVGKIEIACFEDGAGAEVFFVRDNGVGFDMKYKDKLFEVFQRLHSSDEFEGTGVGLAIVQRIVERHGGAVWAEGVEGGGACFFFSLPNIDKLKTRPGSEGEV